MADVTEFFNESDALTVTFPRGAIVNLTYSRAAVTSGLIDPTSTDTNVLAKAISDVVATWDITRGGAAVDPTDAEAVATLPIALIQGVLKRIIQDQNLDPK